MKMEKVDRLEKVFKLIEWVIWLGLFIAAIFYVYDIYHQYLQKTTNFKMATKLMETGITNPTITVCFEPSVKKSSLKKHKLELKDYLAFDLPNFNSNMTWQQFHDEEMSYQLGPDFVIYLEYNSVNNSDFGLQNTTKCNFNKTSDCQICIDKTDVSESESRLIKKVEKLYTLWDGLCYKITPNITATKVLHNYFKLEFNNEEDIPNKTKIFLTSENNSYGIITSKWTEGEVFEVDIEPHKREYHGADLTYSKHERLEETSKCECGCQHRKCLAQKSMEKIEKNREESAPNCLPINYKTLMAADGKTNQTQICKTLEDTETTFAYWNHVYSAIGNCSKPCTKYQYSGKLSTWIGYVSTPKIAMLQYYFSTDELIKHEEYLLFDTMTIIGYVGGTMGLFIGFSFLDLVSRTIYFCFNVCKRKIKRRVSVTPDLGPKIPNGELGDAENEEISNEVEPYSWVNPPRTRLQNGSLQNVNNFQK